MTNNEKQLIVLLREYITAQSRILDTYNEPDTSEGRRRYLMSELHKCEQPARDFIEQITGWTSLYHDVNTLPESKSAVQILFDNGIDIMRMDDNFNTSILQSMQEYKEQGMTKLVEEYNTLQEQANIWKEESGN